MKPIIKRSECPVSYALDFIGDKWTLLILRDIALFGKSTYGEFASSSEKIATNILADRLSMLEANGILNKTVGVDKKSKFVYTLTQKGIDLIPLVMEMAVWASKCDPAVNKSIVDEYLSDKEGTIKKYQNRILQKNLENGER